MSNFSKLIITVDGLNQINHSITLKKQITFTKMAVSSHQYNSGELKTFADVKQYAAIRKIDISESHTITVDSIFNNESNELTEGYFIRTVGLYSKLDNEENEILFAVAVEKTDNPSYMPAHGLTTTAIQIKFRIKLSNTENICITVDSAGMATIGDVLDVSNELRDSVKLINGTIKEVKDDAADMNVTITELKNEKLDKTGIADEALSANALKILRSDSDLNTDVYSDRMMWIREQKADSPNNPSEQLYHVVNIAGMGSNRTQLALGVTTPAVLYRSRESLSAWGEWKKIPLLANGIYNEVLTISNMLRVGKPNNAPFGVELAYNNEGGNVSWYSPDGTRWEFDTCSNVFRLFNYTTLKNFVIDKNGNASFPGHISVADKAQLGNMGVYNGTSNIFYIGGKDAQTNKYPHLKVTQFANSLQVLPTQSNTCTLGHTEVPLECITAQNIYNSSGLITSSDRNKKKDFVDITEEFAEQIIDGLIPTSFKYKDGNSGRTHYGLIAQDVEKLLKELEIDNTDFAPLIKEYPKKEVENEDDSISLETDYEAEPEYFLRYEGFTGLIIKYIQGLKQENKELEEKISQMEDRLTALENKLHNI